jgi:hypothetical protein
MATFTPKLLEYSECFYIVEMNWLDDTAIEHRIYKSLSTVEKIGVRYIGKHGGSVYKIDRFGWHLIHKIFPNQITQNEVHKDFPNQLDE